MGLFSVQRSVADNVHLSQQDNSMRVLHCVGNATALRVGASHSQPRAFDVFLPGKSAGVNCIRRPEQVILDQGSLHSCPRVEVSFGW